MWVIFHHVFYLLCTSEIQGLLTKNLECICVPMTIQHLCVYFEAHRSMRFPVCLRLTAYSQMHTITELSLRSMVGNMIVIYLFSNPTYNPVYRWNHHLCCLLLKQFQLYPSPEGPLIVNRIAMAVFKNSINRYTISEMYFRYYIAKPRNII